MLITEATFSDEEVERAPRDDAPDRGPGRGPSRSARTSASLPLTHLSNRYFGPEIAREARELFPETVVPRDFDVVEVPFEERGTPQLVKGGALHRREPEAVSSAQE